MGKGGVGDGQVVESRDILKRRGDKGDSLRDRCPLTHTHSHRLKGAPKCRTMYCCIIA